MGYRDLGVDEGAVSHDPSPDASPPSIQPSLPNSSSSSGRDPIWAFNEKEMVRLCRAYEEEMGLMYPVIDIEQVIIHGTNLYELIDLAMRTGLANPANAKGFNDEQSCALKMILAISTVVEGDGESEIGYRLFESVKGAADQSMHSETIEIKSLPFLVLVVSRFPYLRVAEKRHVPCRARFSSQNVSRFEFLILIYIRRQSTTSTATKRLWPGGLLDK
jgi:hypothetical protein